MKVGKYIKIISLLLILLFCFSCRHHLLPNTNLRDNSANREITKFMVEYKKALESKDIDKIMSLVSVNFLDDGKKTIDYQGLKEKLQKSFKLIKTLKVNFYIQNVEKYDDKFLLVYYFKQNALVNLPAGDKWISSEDVNKIVLLQDKKSPFGLSILSGL